MSLRYFNPVGADPQMRTGLQTLNPTHALGKMIEAWGERDGLSRSPASTGPRATARASATTSTCGTWPALTSARSPACRACCPPAQTPGYQVINLGTGTGTTVRELLDTFSAVIGEPLASQEVGRRPGDAVGAYARSERSAELLGWRPERSLTEGIRDALTWRARLKAMP